MSLVEGRSPGLRTELPVKGYRGFARLAERIEIEFSPCAQVGIARVRSRKYQMPLCVPPEIVPYKALDSSICIE